MKNKILNQRLLGLEAKLNEFEYEYSSELLEDLLIVECLKQQKFKRTAKRVVILGTIATGLYLYGKLSKKDEFH